MTMLLVLDGMTAYRFWMSSLAPTTPTYSHARNPVLTTLNPSISKRLSREVCREDFSKEPLELLVSQKTDKRYADGLKCRAWGSYEMPADSLCEVGDDIYVIAPELCMVRLATMMPRIAFLRCMTDLMGIYTMTFSDNMTLLEREPITNVQLTRQYLDKLGPVPGCKKVRSALRWVVERSASPRETSLDLLMNMPTRMGGQGMPRFHANFDIPLSEDEQLLAGRTFLIGDMVWIDEETEEVLLVLEYNSDQEHSSLERKIIDLEKITALQKRGLPLIPVTTRQFSRYETFDAIMQTARSILGVRDRYHDEANSKRRATHAEMLLEEKKLRQISSLSSKGVWQFLMPLVI